MSSCRRDVERALVAVRCRQVPCDGEVPDISRIRQILITTPIPPEAFEKPSSRKEVRKDRPPPITRPLHRPVVPDPDSIFDFASLIGDS
jgi:hypothetical protein